MLVARLAINSQDKKEGGKKKREKSARQIVGTNWRGTITKAHEKEEQVSKSFSDRAEKREEREYSAV